MKPIITILIALLLSTYVLSKTKEEWKSRSIYQLLTDRFARTHETGQCDLSQYCGGSYAGIIEHLDYIKGMGFDAIWISPIVENYEGSYHGYHLTNLYNLNEHFGTEDDFKALISACHEKDIWVMVDVVGNHVGPVGTDYSQITPFNSADHYHDYCDIVDWSDQNQVENCRLAGLPDLKQENDWVAQTLYDWINDIVNKYDIDGIRIDTIMEVPKWFWDSFRESAGVFQIGEAFNGDINYVSDYQNHLDSVFNYPLYYTIESSFCGSFRDLDGYWTHSRDKYPAPEYTATFVETMITEDFCTDAMIEVNLLMQLCFLFYGKESLCSIMVENNIIQVEMTLIIGSLYGIIIIQILIYIKYWGKLINLEKTLVFGMKLLYKDMLMIIFMLLLEGMSWLALLILIHFIELLLIMNIVRELNYVTFLPMKIALLFQEEI